jgi:hypothetical protein
LWGGETFEVSFKYLKYLSSSSSIVLTWLSGLRTRHSTSLKIW